MAFQVLVVDDNRRAGRAFARTIEAGTGLVTAFTHEPSEAIEIVRQNHIKVVVVDYQMPAMRGTDLFARIREIEPDIRGILFSANVDSIDLTDAVDRRFQKFLDKNRVADLPELVQVYYQEYLAELAEKGSINSTLLRQYRSGFSLRGAKVQIELLSMTDAPGPDQFVVLANEYSTVVKLDAGQTRKVSVSHVVEREVTLESELATKASYSAQSSSKATGALPMKVEIAAQVTTALEATMRAKYIDRRLVKTEDATEETYTLDNASGPDPTVRSREFQQAPRYERKRALVRVRCECCGMEHIQSFNVLFFSGRWSTRQVDFMSDGTQKVVMTS